MKRNLIIIIGTVLIFSGIVFFGSFLRDVGIYGNGKVELLRLQAVTDSLTQELHTQRLKTDSLVFEAVKLELKWHSQNKKVKAQLKNKYDKQVDNLRVLDADSTIKLLSSWLSEIDSDRRR